MSEITGMWLNRDRARVAIEHDNSGVVTVIRTDQPVDSKTGTFITALFPRTELSIHEWDELFPETDFS